MMFSVREAADRVGKSPTSIRNYTNEFAEYMSQADRSAGQNRLYNARDLALLATIADLKKARKSHEAIKATLDSGELIDWPPEAAEGPESDDFTGTEQTALVTQLSMTVAKFEGELQATKEILEDTKSQLETERQARLSAEIEAARLAGQLGSVYRRHWYQFWKPDKPEEG